MSAKEKINGLTGEILDEELNETPTKEGDSLDTVIVDYEHVFSPEDLAGIAERMVDLDQDEAVITEEKKAIVAEYTSRLKACEAERKKLCMDYRSGSEMRSVDCHAVKDYESQLMLFISIKDCSLIKERPLDHSEQQLSLEDIEVVSGDEDQPAPRCHMKDMVFIEHNDQGLEVWECSVCRGTKTIDNR